MLQKSEKECVYFPDNVDLHDSKDFCQFKDWIQHFLQINTVESLLRLYYLIHSLFTRGSAKITSLVNRSNLIRFWQIIASFCITDMSTMTKFGG